MVASRACPGRSPRSHPSRWAVPCGNRQRSAPGSRGPLQWAGPPTRWPGEFLTARLKVPSALNRLHDRLGLRTTPSIFFASAALVRRFTVAMGLFPEPVHGVFGGRRAGVTRRAGSTRSA
ncbi:hypothetical protein QJS66_02625 [Kocuria rhizophila]|nr:hypothetical protein QJS66_02625 [Kocuria rhizophila]